MKASKVWFAEVFTSDDVVELMFTSSRSNEECVNLLNSILNILIFPLS